MTSPNDPAGSGMTANGSAIDGLRLRARDEQLASGRKLRSSLRRAELAELKLTADRDPIGILRAQNTSRIPQLVPVRRQRMSESPFAFFRGAAAIMAYDLAHSASPGHRVQVCGDAHLSNFGVFAGRDRDLVFDLNDFDETSIGSFEWDLKRLAASVVILADERGLRDGDARKAAEEACRTYRETMHALASLSVTERFFTSITAAELVQFTAGATRKGRRSGKKLLQQAARNTSARLLTKIAVRHADGRYQIEEQPPLTTHIAGLDSAFVDALFEPYRLSVPEFVGNLLSSMTTQDQVVRVVGVGSVGTRCVLILLTDPDGNALFLQAKEAVASVLEAYAGRSSWGSHSRRVVAGQRILQSTGDPFLGHFDLPGGGSYYVRQFRDMKGSVDLEHLADARALASYAAACATSLARAHAQSGTPGVIAGYLGLRGSTNEADRAIADFAFSYAEVNKRDYRRLLDATDDAWFRPAPDLPESSAALA